MTRRKVTTTSLLSEAHSLAARLLYALMSLTGDIPDVRIDDRTVSLTFNQVRALHFIHLRPGIRQKEIAQSLAITQASVSVFMGKMREWGLVDAQPDSDDARAYGLFLTEKGQQVYDIVRQSQTSQMIELLQVIPLARQREIVEAFELALARQNSSS